MPMRVAVFSWLGPGPTDIGQCPHRASRHLLTTTDDRGITRRKYLGPGPEHCVEEGADGELAVKFSANLVGRDFHSFTAEAPKRLCHAQRRKLPSQRGCFCAADAGAVTRDEHVGPRTL